MKVEFLRTVRIAKDKSVYGEEVHAGDERDIADDMALQLIDAGFAKAATQKQSAGRPLGGSKVEQVAIVEKSAATSAKVGK